MGDSGHVMKTNTPNGRGDSAAQNVAILTRTTSDTIKLPVRFSRIVTESLISEDIKAAKAFAKANGYKFHAGSVAA